jgi:hypothetical protein
LLIFVNISSANWLKRDLALALTPVRNQALDAAHMGIFHDILWDDVIDS